MKIKIISLLFIVLLAVLLLLAGGIFVISKKNMAAMNRCVDAAMEKLNAHYTVTSMDPGEFRDLKLFGLLKFNVEQYRVEELGNLSVMRVNMGVMQMATMVITPQNKNLPLLSADYMYMPSGRKAYLEFYDVVKEKDRQYMQLMDALGDIQKKYDHLENFAPAEAWYDDLLTVASFKTGTGETDEDLKNLLTDSLEVYLTHGKSIPVLSEAEREEKRAITAEYTDGLIEKGGVSTDIFKKQLGVEATKRFFDNVLFGTAVR